jgi:putative hemolysin
MEEEELKTIPGHTVQGNFIEIDKVIRNKSPKLGKLLPGFIIRYLKRTLHQDEINEFIRRRGHLFGLPFANCIIEDFGIHVAASGMENIPSTGGCIIAANHPLGGLDGIALITMAGKIRHDILFPVNDLLMNLNNLRELFIPVNKHGSNAENIKLFDQTFASDAMILYFPAGLVSRKQNHGVIKDLEWKKTFISKAKKFERDIVPAYIDGRNTNFFYNLAKFRKKAGIKQNIEMLYLVDEMYKQHNKTIQITFGKKIPWQTFDRSHSDVQWAAKMKAHVYNLPAHPDTLFE